MENSKTELGVKEIIAQLSGYPIEEFDNETNVKQELNIDSLDEVEIIMKLEEVFDIEISDDEAEKIETVADYVAIVERLTANNTEVNFDNENVDSHAQ